MALARDYAIDLTRLISHAEIGGVELRDFLEPAPVEDRDRLIDPADETFAAQSSG